MEYEDKKKRTAGNACLAQTLGNSAMLSQMQSPIQRTKWKLVKIFWYYEAPDEDMDITDENQYVGRDFLGNVDLFYLTNDVSVITTHYKPGEVKKDPYNSLQESLDILRQKKNADDQKKKLNHQRKLDRKMRMDQQSAQKIKDQLAQSIFASSTPPFVKRRIPAPVFSMTLPEYSLKYGIDLSTLNSLFTVGLSDLSAFSSRMIELKLDLDDIQKYHGLCAPYCTAYKQGKIIQAHHLISSKALNILGIDPNTGWCISIAQPIHVLTESYGNDSVGSEEARQINSGEKTLKQLLAERADEVLLLTTQHISNPVIVDRTQKSVAAIKALP